MPDTRVQVLDVKFKVICFYCQQELRINQEVKTDPQGYLILMVAPCGCEESIKASLLEDSVITIGGG